MTLNRWILNRIDNIATGIWVAKACQCLSYELDKHGGTKERKHVLREKCHRAHYVPLSI